MKNLMMAVREDLYLRLWDLGFDHFTTDYPETMFHVIERITKSTH